MNKELVGSADEIIDIFIKDNELSLMDLELYLFARGIVCMSKSEYENND